MKRVKLVLSVAIVMLMAMAVNGAMGMVAGVVFLAMAMMPREKGVVCMAVTPEIWIKDIEGNLFKDDEFIQKSVDESQYVVGGTGTPQTPLLISNYLWLLSLLILTFQNRTIKLNESSKRWPKGGQGFGVQVRLMYGLYVSALLFVKVFKNNSITRNTN